MQENENIVENTNTETTKVKKSKKTTKTTKTKKGKFNAKILVPIIFIVVVLIVAFSVFQSLFQDGPVYGDRCAGVTEIDETKFDSIENAILQNEAGIEKITIDINCKTFAIDLTMVEGSTEDVITSTCENVLLEIDNAIGLSKSNSESKYTDLFGTYNGKTQYHVDFTIEGSEEIYPVFASKHPASDTINFTYNVARDPELVDKLTTPEPETEPEVTE